jgi:hypothetical protein
MSRDLVDSRQRTGAPSSGGRAVLVDGHGGGETPATQVGDEALHQRVGRIADLHHDVAVHVRFEMADDPGRLRYRSEGHRVLLSGVEIHAWLTVSRLDVG